MAAIYSAEASCRALSAAKDAGWAGRVKQLPGAILSAVMSQRQQSAIEQWQLTPFWDSKEKHRNEMGTKIPSHLALMGFWSFCASLPSLFSLVILIQMKASYSDYFSISTTCRTSKLSLNSFSQCWRIASCHPRVCQGQMRPVTNLRWSATQAVPMLLCQEKWRHERSMCQKCKRRKR